MAAIHSDEFKRDAVRIALSSGLTRRQVASDLGIGLSTLGKWVRAVSEEAKVPAQDSELLRENERLRKENRDLDAIRNAIEMPWSNGQAEGQINRLNTLKRAIFGRAGPELLRARMLPLRHTD